jgi:Peptidase S24-like
MSSPAAVWRPVVTEVLRERVGAGESIWLPIRGRSMRPLLGPGARIFVTPPARVRFGDLLAYECEGALVCHRVIGRRGAALLTRADHRGAGPEVVAAAQIVGVVAAFERDGVAVDLFTPRLPALATLAAARSLTAAACLALRRRAWPRA